MSANDKNPDRIKIALIPVLGLILLWVVAGGEDDAPVAAELATSTSETDSPAKPERSAGKKQKANWPSESLQLIASHNPFELTDPRVVIDNLFRESGLLTDPVMTEVKQEVFFAELETGQQRDERFLDELWIDLLAKTDNPDQVSPSPAATITSVTGSAAKPEADAVSAMEKTRLAEQEKKYRQAKLQFDQLQQRLVELQSQKVTMIMESRKGKSALLGDRHITEGELVEAGIRVASIGGDGITFEIETPATSFD